MININTPKINRNKGEYAIHSTDMIIITKQVYRKLILTKLKSLVFTIRNELMMAEIAKNGENQ